MNSSVVVTSISHILPSDFGGSSESQNKFFLDFSYKFNEKKFEEILGKRFTKKRDKSVNSAIIASRNLFADFKKTDYENAGIILSNNLGGWNYVEHQLADLYIKGDMSVINPYVATAWFPTAAQGEISICNNILGYSKTFCGGELGAGFAIKHARDLILSNKLSEAVVGAVEAPNTKLISNIFYKEILVDGCILFFIEDFKKAKETNRDVLIEIRDINVSASLDILNDVFDNSCCLYTDSEELSHSLLKKNGQKVNVLKSLPSKNLFSLKIPIIILNLYERFKGKNKKIVFITQDESQFLSISLKIL